MLLLGFSLLLLKQALHNILSPQFCLNAASMKGCSPECMDTNKDQAVRRTLGMRVPSGFASPVLTIGQNLSYTRQTITCFMQIHRRPVRRGKTVRGQWCLQHQLKHHTEPARNVRHGRRAAQAVSISQLVWTKDDSKVRHLSRRCSQCAALPSNT